MGYLKDKHGCILLDKAPPGTCPMCANMHDPQLPHNKDSLLYQYKFYDEHGRWPTWRDAMSHCSEEMKTFWIEALREKGVEV